MLRPSTEAFVGMINKAAQAPGAKSTSDKPLTQARAEYTVMLQNLGADSPDSEVCWGEITVPIAAVKGSVAVGCRYYVPEATVKSLKAGADFRVPVCLYLHGGGWTLGNPEGYHSFCMTLCFMSGLAIVSADYRLAPEHPCPAAATDAFTVFSWLTSGNATLPIDSCGVALDPDAVSISGDSAGGNLTLVLGIMAREAGVEMVSKIKLLLPLCPSTDLRAPSSVSMAKYGTGHFLTAESMAFFRKSYTQLDDEVCKGYIASPLLAADLSGLPPTLLVTASHDPLVSEGKAFYDRLLEAGVQARYMEYAGEIHVFWLFGKMIHGAVGALEDIAGALRSSFRGHSGVSELKSGL